MEVIRLKEKEFKANNYLVIEGKIAVLIDASVGADEINEKLLEFDAKLKAIFITHAHFDHILSLDSLINAFDCPVYLNKEGLESLYDEEKNISKEYKPLTISDKSHIKTFGKFEEIKVDDLTINAYQTAGHSECSSIFEIGDYLFTGDTLFKGFIGRNDLWNSNVSHQQQTLRFLKGFHKKEVYYSGHGIHFNYDDAIRTIDKYLID